MGHWDTQHGEITLPSAEFAAVRQTVQKATHEHQTKVFDETQSFWKGLTRKKETGPAAYTAALTPHAKDIIEDAGWRLGLPCDGKPARVLKSDLPFPTNRTTTCGDDNGRARPADRAARVVAQLPAPAR